MKQFEEAACGAALAAGKLLRSRFGGEIKVETKGLHDFVTEVDREAETIVHDYLSQRFPDHAIMSEEASPGQQRSGGYRWIVDPLDGTTNFIHRVPTFAVSIGLENDDGLVAGAIYDPLRDEMFHAHRGGGARLNGNPIRCRRPEKLGDALIATGFPFRELSRVGPYLAAFEAFIRSTAGLRRAGSASLDMAYTACGRYDAFWECGLSPWDIAAGIVLIEEAGGRVTDLIGGHTTMQSGDIVAAEEQFHRSVLEVTRSAFEA